MFPSATTKYESVKYDACNMVMDGAAESEKLRGGGQNALQIGAEISITLSFKESFRVTHSPLFRGAAPLPADPPDDVDPTHSLSLLSRERLSPRCSRLLSFLAGPQKGCGIAGKIVIGIGMCFFLHGSEKK